MRRSSPRCPATARWEPCSGARRSPGRRQGARVRLGDRRQRRARVERQTPDPDRGPRRAARGRAAGGALRGRPRPARLGRRVRPLRGRALLVGRPRRHGHTARPLDLHRDAGAAAGARRPGRCRRDLRACRDGRFGRLRRVLVPEVPLQPAPAGDVRPRPVRPGLAAAARHAALPRVPLRPLGAVGCRLPGPHRRLRAPLCLRRPHARRARPRAAAVRLLPRGGRRGGAFPPLRRDPLPRRDRERPRAGAAHRARGEPRALRR
jgi:hypothetical protein